MTNDERCMIMIMIYEIYCIGMYRLYWWLLTIDMMMNSNSIRGSVHCALLLLLLLLLLLCSMSIWEPIAHASLRIMKGHMYFSIRDCKTLDWSAIGLRLRQTIVVWESTIVRGEINIIHGMIVTFQLYIIYIYCIRICLDTVVNSDNQ